MTEADRTKFAKAMLVLSEMFNEAVSETRAEAYFVALQDLDIDQVNFAVRRALRACKFFPKPVELLELLQGEPEANADAAWSAVLKEITGVGYLGTPQFGDPKVLSTIRDVWGSWRRLCETLPVEGPELVGWMKQFKSAYRSVGVRLEHDAALSGLPSALRERLADLARHKGMPGAPDRAHRDGRTARVLHEARARRAAG